MKVKELIERLQKEDPNANVFIRKLIFDEEIQSRMPRANITVPNDVPWEPNVIPNLVIIE